MSGADSLPAADCGSNINKYFGFMDWILFSPNIGFCYSPPPCLIMLVHAISTFNIKLIFNMYYFRVRLQVVSKKKCVEAL